MPPSRRSSSSHRSSGPSHRSSSSHRSSGPSHRSSGSHFSFGGSSSHTGSGYHGSYHSSHSSYDHNSDYGAGASGLFHNLSGLFEEEDLQSSYGIFTDERKSFHNTMPSRSGYSPSAKKDHSYGNGTYRTGSFLSDDSDAPIVLNRMIEHQPPGYPQHDPEYPVPMQYHCQNHDYIYYGRSWYDAKTKTTYSEGYYDEDGILHTNIYLTGEQNPSEQVFVCPYCQTKIKAAWKEGAVPSCPNCCAQLEEIETDIVLDRFSVQSSHSASQRKGPGSLIIMLIVILSAFSTCVSGITYYISSRSDSRKSDSAVTAPASASQIQHNSNTIYVEEIDRNCNWLTSADSYYDTVTDCYFVYEDHITVPAWHYWYEDISSDFGDYGWMEYDEKEQQWYIEKAENTWIPLPDKYDTNTLWHIKEY